MSTPKVTVGLILFKGEKYLSQSLPSLVNQDYPNIEFLWRDQSPNGEALEYIQKNLPAIAQKIPIERGENLMHSGGHNALMRKMSGEYYFCCSCDMLYSPDFISKIVAELEKPENKKYGSATCKLMRWDFKEKTSGQHEKNETGGKNNFIDSFGIGITKSHHFFDAGQGEEDKGQYDNLQEVFGTSGALAVFRKEALENIAYTNQKGLPEYYDELLHYKNDIDLAYRLQWAGYPCLFIKTTKVWHDRQVSGEAEISKIKGMIKARGDKAQWVKENSFFGHIVVLKKNVFGQQFSLPVRLKTWIMHILRICYIAVFERALLQQFKEVKKHAAEIQDKTLKMPGKVQAKEIEKYMA